MSEELRVSLYLLGFVPQLLFGLRFCVQWLASERMGEACVPKLFWQFSFVGHLLMVLHSYIQLQYHIALFQGFSFVIAWRNLDLMGSAHYSWRSAIVGFCAVFLGVTLLFFLTDGAGSWFRTPHIWGNQTREVLDWKWHLMGIAAMILFSSRFWVQWWLAEWRKESYLGLPFWWISLVANLLLFVYFWRLGDVVNWIGPFLSVVPTVRNIMLIQRAS